MDSDSPLNQIFTTYFFNQVDPLRNVHAPNDDISYIRPWYFSMVELGLHGVVFHDGLSKTFIEGHQTDRIRFEYVAPETFTRSLNDYRFYIWRDYLLAHPEIEHVFMTDGNDLSVARNPFDRLRDDWVYVGSEGMDLRENKWMQRRFYLLNQGQHEFKVKTSRLRRNPCYSAGILGGSRQICLEFLNDMIETFERLDPGQQEVNLNMAVFNHTIYQRFRKRAVTGEPVHSLYKRYQSDRRDVWFIHK